MSKWMFQLMQRWMENNETTTNYYHNGRQFTFIPFWWMNWISMFDFWVRLNSCSIWNIMKYISIFMFHSCATFLNWMISYNNIFFSLNKNFTRKPRQQLSGKLCQFYCRLTGNWIRRGDKTWRNCISHVSVT